MEPFSITGKIVGLDLGSVLILSLTVSTYRDIYLDSNKVQLKEGNFRIKAKISYPHAFRLMFKTSSRQYVSEFVFLDKGEQKLFGGIDSLNDHFLSIDQSKSNAEFIGNFFPEYRKPLSYLFKYDSLSRLLYQKYQRNPPSEESQKLKNLTDTFKTLRRNVITAYSKKNPDSYVSLWLLTERLTNEGFNEEYVQAFERLSSNVKNTKTGKELLKNIQEAKVTGIGKVFPKLKLLTQNNQEYTIENFNSKYTLIDFWYSRCSPCIAQFPHLSKMYSTYKDKGFTIINVSVDTKKDKDDWLKAIEKYNLKWQQLLDIGAAQSSRLFINVYPTNFLLDTEGKIIARNIAPEELENFLGKNLK